MAYPQVASHLDAEEFVSVVKVLSTLRSMQALVARQELINMIMSQCHLEQGWNVRHFTSTHRRLYSRPVSLLPAGCRYRSAESGCHLHGPCDDAPLGRSPQTSI